MFDKLMDEFGIGPGGVSSLSSAYYWAYALLQLPAGIAVDRWGFLWCELYMAAICAAGVIAFGLATEMWVALLGRALIGGGTAGCFVALIRLVQLCFPRHMASLTGAIVFAGFLGSMLGQAPVAALIESGVDWRTFTVVSAAFPAAAFLGFAGLLYALRCGRWGQRGTVAAVVPAGMAGRANARAASDPLQDAPERDELPLVPAAETVQIPMRRKLRDILTRPANVVIALTAFMVIATLNTFASLWAPPFLMTSRGMDRESAAFLSSAILFGYGLSAPFWGTFSGVLGASRLLLSASVVGLVAMSAALYIPDLGDVALFILYLVAGLATPLPALFTAINEHNPPSHQAVAAAAMNTFLMLNGATFQPLVAWLLDEGDHQANGDPTADSYSAALLVYPISFFIGALGSTWLLCFDCKHGRGAGQRQAGNPAAPGEPKGAATAGSDVELAVLPGTRTVSIGVEAPTSPSTDTTGATPGHGG